MGTILVTLPDIPTVKGSMTGPFDMEDNKEKFKELIDAGYVVFTHIDLDYEIRFNAKNQAYLIRKNLVPQLVSDAIELLQTLKNALKLDYSVKEDSISVNMYTGDVLKDLSNLQSTISHKLQNA
jgi:hypothetical protein